MEALTYRQFWWKWILFCGFGVMLSMAAAASLAVGYNYAMGYPTTFVAGALNMLVLLGAGVVQGTILGLFQWSVLSKKYQFLKMTEWVGYTIAVSVLGWALGMIPAMFSKGSSVTVKITKPVPGPHELTDSTSVFNIPVFEETVVQEPSLWSLILSAAAIGLFLGALFGLFQWLALRRHSKRAGSWILANALGWSLGMIWIFLAAVLSDNSTPIPLIVGMGIAGGILAGLSISAITGWFLLWMPLGEEQKAKDEN